MDCHGLNVVLVALEERLEDVVLQVRVVGIRVFACYTSRPCITVRRSCDVRSEVHPGRSNGHAGWLHSGGGMVFR